MIKTTIGRQAELHDGLRVAVATYRYEVFIKKLGWKLPIRNQQETDQFDRSDTVYVVAQRDNGEVCGCARLLPTTRPYLLGQIFPYLLGGAPVPNSEYVWEVSRFSSMELTTDCYYDQSMGHLTARMLLSEVVRFAHAAGIKRLITVSLIAIERLLRRMNVHFHRAAPPCLVDGRPTFACWIEIDDLTLHALDVNAASDCRFAKNFYAGHSVPCVPPGGVSHNFIM